MTPDAARRYYREQKAITAGIVRRSLSAWAALDPAHLDASWRSARLGEQLFVIVSAGQATAASRTDRYLDEVLAELGIDLDAAGSIDPRSFAGIASDGRSLESLLYEPVIAAKTAAASSTPTNPYRSGESHLARIVSTQLADAGSAAVATAIAARPAVTGYVRMLVPPSCGRCAVLAGKRFRWNTGFQRHPHCDCRHIPTAENIAGDLTSDPREYFDSLTAEQQARYFGRGAADAIREGADIGQVVNARRGMTAAGTTTEGTTRRGFAGRLRGANTRAAGSRFGNPIAARARSTPRLMPERIMRDARSRTEAVDLLREHGYLV